MSRAEFHAELEALQASVMEMGSMVSQSVGNAMSALSQADLTWAQQIIEGDAAINARRFEVEEHCLFLIASQQPVATDLRELATVLYVITDLERIADHAEGIARINLLLGPEDVPPRRLGFIPGMADRAAVMLDDSMRAYATRDVQLALRVCDADDEVDRLQDYVYDELIQAMIDRPESITRNTYLLWTAHNLERMADRCTNICERVVFTVTGKMQEINVSKY